MIGRGNRRVSATVRRSGDDYRVTTVHRVAGLPMYTDVIYVVVLRDGVLGAFTSERRVA